MPASHSASESLKSPDGQFSHPAPVFCAPGHQLCRRSHSHHAKGVGQPCLASSADAAKLSAIVTCLVAIAGNPRERYAHIKIVIQLPSIATLLPGAHQLRIQSMIVWEVHQKIPDRLPTGQKPFLTSFRVLKVFQAGWTALHPKKLRGAQLRIVLRTTAPLRRILGAVSIGSRSMRNHHVSTWRAKIRCQQWASIFLRSKM
jgi:hypothetical protein